MTTIDTIKAEIAAVEAAIAQAQPLADKLAEMQAAVAAIADAQRRIEVLRSRLTEAEFEEKSRTDALDRYTIKSITGEGLATRRKVIALERRTGLYGPEVQELSFGLDNLPPDLWAVVLANPDCIPTDIRALDPDPAVAVGKHARAVSRGYWSN